MQQAAATALLQEANELAVVDWTDQALCLHPSLRNLGQEEPRDGEAATDFWPAGRPVDSPASLSQDALEAKRHIHVHGTLGP